MASDAPGAGPAPRPAARLLKIIGLALAAIVVLAAAAVAFLSSRWFAAAVESSLATAMREGGNRTLRFDGPLEFFFWPDAGFRVGRVELSEPGGAAPFASLDSAALRVRVAPLLVRQVVIDECAVAGLKLSIVRHRDGTLNIDDLISPSQSPAGAYQVEAARIGLDGATLAWVDEAGGSATTATGIALSGANLRADTAKKSMSADALSLAGAVGDARLRLGLEGVAASPAALNANRLVLGLDYRSAGTAVAGSLAARLAADPAGGAVALDDVAGKVEVAHPRLLHPLALPLAGSLHTQRGAAEGRLSSHFDESTASIALRMKRFSPPALHFDIDLDRLDVGRYLAPANGDGGGPGQPAGPSRLSVPQGLELDGVARIGSLEVAGMKTRNIRLEIRSEGGAVGVRSLDAAGK
ncbi:MAG TPA: AsmA family protein [Rhodocyclaceae bacterium]